MPPKPKLHDFQTLEAYLEELVDWKFRLWLHDLAIDGTPSDCRWLRNLGVDPEL